MLLRGRFAILIVNILFFKMAILVVLNFVDFNPATQTSAFNSFASIMALLFVIAVPTFYFFQTLVFFGELRSLKRVMKKDRAAAEESEEDYQPSHQVKEKKEKLKKSFRN